jgi:hypothetical protein
MRFRDKGTVSVQQILCDGGLVMNKQALGKKAWDRKKARQVKSMFISFFDIKGIVLKEFILAGQTVNSAFYCNALWRLRENVRRLRLEL